MGFSFSWNGKQKLWSRDIVPSLAQLENYISELELELLRKNLQMNSTVFDIVVYSPKYLIFQQKGTSKNPLSSNAFSN